MKRILWNTLIITSSLWSIYILFVIFVFGFFSKPPIVNNCFFWGTFVIPHLSAVLVCIYCIVNSIYIIIRKNNHAFIDYFNRKRSISIVSFILSSYALIYLLALCYHKYIYLIIKKSEVYSPDWMNEGVPEFIAVALCIYSTLFFFRCLKRGGSQISPHTR